MNQIISFWTGAVSVCIVLAVGTISSRADDVSVLADRPLGASAGADELTDDWDAEGQTVTAAEDRQSSPTEIVRERFPDGKLKIEREVTLDAEGNYINHGLWRMFDVHGNVLAEGRYHDNLRQGSWIRRYNNENKTELMSAAPYSEFDSPIVSQAQFDDGKLNGKWTICDGKQRKISEINYVDGERHGAAAWWYANGRKMQEVVYHEGVIDGTLTTWKPDGTELRKDTYQKGRRLAPKTVNHPDGEKKSKGIYLHAKMVVKTPDDWWNARLAVYTTEGEDVRHGSWMSWHTNGKPQQQGEYENDLPVGQFTWWYANTQKALEGSYLHGKRSGKWTWWHENGLKSCTGEYAEGSPVGVWMWWKDDGKLTQKADFSIEPANIVNSAKEPQPRTSLLMPTIQPPDAKVVK